MSRKFPTPIRNPLRAEDEDRTDPSLEVPGFGGVSGVQALHAAMGPLDALMRDPEITEIMVNDTRNVTVEKDGRLHGVRFRFERADELQAVIDSLLAIIGRTLGPEQPCVDAMLPDGSRINIVSGSLTVSGPCLTIRKFPTHRMTSDDLVRRGMMDQRMLQFLNACVVGKLNILISGGTGSGKTTVLSALAGAVPASERLITIEDTPELVISQPNSIRMQTMLGGAEAAAVTARELVANALRMRPDRIIIGECRRSEAFDMLQAMNTGHAGSMTTLHANSPRDALIRLETLCMMAGIEMPLAAIRRQVAGAIDLILHIKRFRNGRRRIIAISEVTGMEGEVITLQDLFLHETDAKGEGDGGRFRATGLVPAFVGRLKEAGVDFPPGFFA